MQILHNPRCRKSRETLQLITDAGIEPEIIEYLKEHHKDRYDDGVLEGIEVEDPRRHGPKGLQIILRTPPLHKFRVVVPLWESVELSS